MVIPPPPPDPKEPKPKAARASAKPKPWDRHPLVKGPGKYNDEIASAIISLIWRGNFKETAAREVGLPVDTLKGWLRKGAAGEEPYATFLKRVEAALAHAESGRVRGLIRAAKTDWRAHAWWLERARPKKWAARVRVTVEQELDAFLDAAKDRLANLDQLTGADAYRIILEIAAGLRVGAEGGDAAGEAAAGAEPTIQ